MSPKLAIPLVLIGLTAAPAAVIAYQNRVSLHAFSTEGHAFSAAAGFGAKALTRLRAEEPEERRVTLPPTLITGVRPALNRATPRSETPTVCGDWRALRSGPSARAVNAPLVLACEGPMRDPGEARPTSTVSAPARQAAPRGPAWSYTVDLAAPR